MVTEGRESRVYIRTWQVGGSERLIVTLLSSGIVSNEEDHIKIQDLLEAGGITQTIETLQQ